MYGFTTRENGGKNNEPAVGTPSSYEGIRSKNNAEAGKVDYIRDSNYRRSYDGGATFMDDYDVTLE
ncbi:hypothetical protein GCM10025859_06300 [Alicyclobacillus fastidiosus]|nr:hypothetical protein GCM10025859_06300 [Alicyclobacillus fastidiosus]